MNDNVVNTEIRSVDIETIQRILPHRYPFLLVDRLTEVQIGKRAVGLKNVSMNEPHFQGHFPSEPVMPGVLIVEALAQTGGLLVGLTIEAIDRNLLVYFMAVDNCKFRRKVVPGDQLKLEVDVLRGRKGGKVWRLGARASVDGEVAAETELTAMMIAKEG